MTNVLYLSNSGGKSTSFFWNDKIFSIFSCAANSTHKCNFLNHILIEQIFRFFEL